MNETTNKKKNFLLTILPVLMLLMGFLVAGFLVFFTHKLMEITYTLKDDDITFIVFTIIVTIIIAAYIGIRFKKHIKLDKES